MAPVTRVLDPDPVASLADHEAAGGGKALGAARGSEPVAVIEVVEASGLRGRGGAGFPTGTKWRTVAGMGGDEPGVVVVNAAEGEPGTLKDRTLLRRNPYKVLEGALIAAHAVAADRIVVGMKRSATTERRPRRASRRGDGAGRVAPGDRDRRRRRLRPLPARRGDGPPRGHRGPATLPAHRPSVPRGGGTRR